MLEFPSKIVNLRKIHKVTQKQIACSIMMSERGYQKLEAGDSTPTVDTIIKLCNYFNISADYLLGLSDEPRPLREENISSDQKQ